MTLADGAVAATTAARRPTVGDRVVLTADFASHADASGGMSAARRWLLIRDVWMELAVRAGACDMRCTGPLKPGDVGVIEKDDGSGGVIEMVTSCLFFQ